MNAAQPFDPYAEIERLGIRVAQGPLRTANGLWIPEERLIILKRGLKSWHERQVLTHELGHALLGHNQSTPRNEFLADTWAARKLIAPDHLAEVAQMSPDPGVWAIELGVTEHMMDLYLHGLHRAS